MHSGMLNLGLAVVRNLTKILSSRTRFVFSSWLPSHTISLKFWPTPTLDAVSSTASVTPFRRRDTGIFVMWLERQLSVGISYTILSVSFSGSPKSLGSQSSWSLPSPPPNPQWEQPAQDCQPTRTPRCQWGCWVRWKICSLGQYCWCLKEAKLTKRIRIQTIKR